MILFNLLAAYGFTFALQNKAPYLRGKVRFVDALLKCVYCTGFHAGWLTWAGASALTHTFPKPSLAPIAALTWAFASAAFCYVVDTAARWLERPTPK